MMINVTKSYLGNIETFKAYVDRIYASNWLTNHGPLCRELEERLREYLDVPHLILVNNGTLALQVAYRALGISGSAITTPFSFVATSSTLAWEGIRPIFADIHPRTWNLDPAGIERRLSRDTQAIVATHVFGNPCDVDAIGALAARRNLKVVYDGAHAFGVRYNGQSVLTQGDVCTLSLHATKLFHTIEGGAIVTRDESLARELRLLCNFGITGVDQIAGLGVNGKLNEFCAAMGLCVLDDIELIMEQRQAIADHYCKRLNGYVDLQQHQAGSDVNNAYFPVALQNEAAVLAVRTALNDQGINPRRYFYPSLDTVDYLNADQPQPQSRQLSQRILCLPIFPGLAREDQDKVIDTLLAHCAVPALPTHYAAAI